ncbi:MAG: DUF4105 domain-containing protein [Bacteroidaceae bacterium]|nr:DUF4105 domain-containing protein [Bacteroidaceae bacterium]
MKRLTAYLLTLFLALVAMAQGTEADSAETALPTDVYAYYVVVTPGNTFTSMMGHAAIRMQCPSAGLDYCFTVKSPEIGNEFTAMTLRTLRAGLVPEKTPQFRADYESEGRGLTAYRLNLTLDEVRTLWKLLDNRVSQGLYRNIDYIHNGCAQEMISLLTAAAGEHSVDFDSIANELLPYENRRQILARYMDASQWKGFIGHSLYGGSPDEPVWGVSKLIMPMDVATALQQAGLASQPEVLSEPTLADAPTTFSPQLCSLLFLLLCLVPVSVRPFHHVLWALHFLAGLFLVWLVFISKTPGTEWNWFVIPFCPLPFLLRHWAGRRIYFCYSLILLGFLLFMVAGLDRLFFVEQLPVVAGIFIRTTYKSLNINLLKKQKQR